MILFGRSAKEQFVHLGAMLHRTCCARFWAAQEAASPYIADVLEWIGDPWGLFPLACSNIDLYCFGVRNEDTSF